MKWELITLTLLTLCAAASSNAPASEPYFIGLGHLPGGGNSGAVAVSDDGTVVVGDSRNANGGTEAFRWTSATGMVGIGFLSSELPLSSATDVSADGDTIVGSSFANGPPYLHAFRWTSELGMADLGYIDDPDLRPSSQGTGVSADGTVVVGLSGYYGQSTVAFRWTSIEGMIALEELPGGRRLDIAHDISPDATVIVGSAWGTESVRACRWTELEGLVTLGVLPGYLRSEACSTSAGGSVIVGVCSSEDGYTAFRWTPDIGMVALGPLPNPWLHAGVAYVVSVDGGLIVGEAHSDDGHAAMIWTAATGARDLNVVLERDLGVDLDGWTLKEAYGLSSDGRYVVGHGTNPNGGSEAWLAYLGDPIPCRGDIDGDGLRNLVDLTMLLTAYGSDDGGDIDRDGDTDLADLGWLLTVYGQPCLRW